MNPIKLLTYFYYWSRKVNNGNSFSAIVAVSAILSLNFLTILIFVDFLMTKFGYFSPYDAVTSEQTFLGKRISSYIIPLVIILMVLFYYFLNKLKIKNWLQEFKSLDNTDQKKWKIKSNFYLILSFIVFVLSALTAAI